MPKAIATAQETRAVTKRAVGLEQETQQLRETLMKAANLIECWKSERIKMAEENARLKQETEYMKGIFVELSQETREYGSKTRQRNCI